MVSAVDLARSLDSYAAQSAAAPASISPPLPPGSKPREAIEPNPASDHVTISDEGTRALQRAAERDAEQAAAREAAGRNAELGARMTRAMAYRRDVVITPPSAYSNLATSLYTRGTSPAANAASIVEAQADLDQARLARIALYEFEKARGTPAAEIFDSLARFDASRRHDQQLAVIS